MKEAVQLYQPSMQLAHLAASPHSSRSLPPQCGHPSRKVGVRNDISGEKLGGARHIYGKS